MTPPDHLAFLNSLPGEHIRSATRLGLELGAKLDRDSWSRLITELVRLTGRNSGTTETLTAWLGDVLAYGEGKYRGQITAYAEAARLRPGTLRDAKLVCSRIPMSCRRDTLSWSHHCEIARAFDSPIEIKSWLSVAESERLSKAQLRKRISAHRRGAPPASREGDAVSFVCMRDLRALERVVRQHRSVWTEWPPQACRFALSELSGVVAFIAAINRRAEESAAESGPVDAQR